MTSLTEFLLARLAEDEAEALASLETGYQPPAWGPEDKPDPIPDFYDPPSDLDRKRAARVLADVEAKRRIVGQWFLPDDGGELWDNGFVAGQESARDTTLRLLALPYADHPDYDESWRP